jgi:hypothetical protein
MKRTISSILVLGAAVTGISQNAVAHERGYELYDPPRHYSVTVYRDHHMPRWLRKKKDFRRWYKRSALKHNQSLAWRQLYEIYRWESRYHRQHHHRPTYYANRDYGWYRNYWHKQQRRYRHDRERHKGDRREDRHRDRYRYRD